MQQLFRSLSCLIRTFPLIPMPNSTNSLQHFLSTVVDRPQVFFASNPKIADDALSVAKHFYDNVKKVETSQLSPFTELFLEGFDNDQVWEEIVSQNEPFLNYASSMLNSFGTKPQAQRGIDETTIDDSEEDRDSASGRSMELDSADGLSSENEDEEMEEPLETSEAEGSEEEQLEEEDANTDNDAEEGEKVDIPKKKTSEVDDDFFNLEEFNKWTDEQERIDMMSDREEDEDDIDFDQDLDEVDSEEESDTSEGHARDEDDTLEGYAREEDDTSAGHARDLFADDDESDAENDGEEKSAFEKQQERIQQQIQEFEQENIQGRHWTLQGEATAKARPVNSLLEEDLEFEHANKPVPVITQETTNTLEEMIKKRILDNMFDDVERKVDPTLKPFIPSKRVEISDEKSKQSLAEIYEEDFVHQQAGEKKKDARDEALEKEHGEITQMFNDLCYKLDALSNFHYTPKAVKPEMTIVSNAAAISMEEVTPVNVSEATLLAPEEVYEKKRTDLKATTEMDQAEKKRLRAQKKKLKRKEREMKEREIKIMQKYNPQIGQKQAKVKAVKQLLGQKNVTVIGKNS